jgi:GNAT superfamily N-acetyltransferase
MKDVYRLGVADTEAEIRAVTDFAAAMPQTYGAKRQAAWAYGKLRSRLSDGENMAYPAFYDGSLVAVTVAAPHPATGPDARPSVELKLVRTLETHREWGIGRAVMKGAINAACLKMGLDRGAAVDVCLDTRDSDAMHAFEHMGFHRVGTAQLYGPDEIYDDTPHLEDVLYRRQMFVPANLYDRPGLAS